MKEHNYIFSINFQNSLPIFHQKWWLDIVTPNTWQYIIHETGNLIVIWPIIVQKKWGFSFSKMPPLTQCLGPWICKPEYEQKITLAEELKIYEELLHHMPQVSVFKQYCHPEIKQWLAFYWRGFEQSTRYTYRVKTNKTSDELWQSLSRTRRRRIRSAEKKLKIVRDEDVHNLVNLVEQTYYRQNIPNPISRFLIEKIYREALSAQKGIILSAEDLHTNKITATCFFVWDNFTLYYLIGAYDAKEDRDACGMSSLIWNGIQLAKKRGIKFDFEGSMVKNIGFFFRSFGAGLVPYFEIKKVESRILKILYGVKKL